MTAFMLAANRRDYHQTDLIPDTYRTSNTAKVLIGSHRDNFLDNVGRQTFDYDPEVTTGYFDFMANDGNFNGSMPTMTWRDYDGSGQLRVQKGGDGGAPGADMLVGSGPNPYARKTMYKLWNTGTFERQYKVDQTMVKPYSEAETGLSYDIDIDHSESPQVRLQRNILEHERSLNWMQKQRQKPDTYQQQTDDMRVAMLNRPYSYNGSSDSNASRQMERHGAGPTLAKQGIWHDIRERSEQLFKRLRIAVDGDIAYERNTPAPQVIDSGRRTNYIPTEPNEPFIDMTNVSRAPAPHGLQVADLQAQDKLYESRKVENLINRIAANSTLETPRAAVYQYDNRKLFERQAMNLTMRNLMEAKERDQDMRNDIEAEETRLVQTRLSIQMKAAGPVMSIAPSDMDAHDERQIAHALAANGDPVGAAETRNDMQVLEARLAASNSPMTATEFVTMTGRVIESMNAHEVRQTENRGAADLAEAGSVRADTQASSEFYDTRKTPNAMAQMAKNAGRAIADGDAVHGESHKWDERTGNGGFTRDLRDPHTVDRDVGEVSQLQAHETIARAAKYRGGGNSIHRSTDKAVADRPGHIGGIVRR